VKVVVVHNRYRSASPSGENQVVEAEVGMLRDAGVEVLTYERDSDEIADFGPWEKATLPVRPLVSPADASAFRALVRRERPDVVHLHNPFPLISPWVVRVAASEGVPVVQSVHNFRHVCVNGVLFRDGEVCEDCVGRRAPWPAVVHRCYQDALAPSAVMAAVQTVHRSTWRRVARFLAVSSLMAERLVTIGVDSDRVTVKRNALVDPGEAPGPGDGFLFAARLVEEKGLRLLLAAWARSGLGAHTTLTIAGDGPLRALVDHSADPSIRFLGQVTQARVLNEMAHNYAMVVPSLCYEGGCPLTAVASFARRRPVVATDVWTTGSVVSAEVGWLARPDEASLAEALLRCARDPEERERRGAAGRMRYLTTCTPEQVASQLVNTYQEVYTSMGRGRLSGAATAHRRPLALEQPRPRPTPRPNSGSAVAVSSPRRLWR
jgi:glycosyltransferase involved in cell wall biosynthesis